MPRTMKKTDIEKKGIISQTKHITIIHSTQRRAVSSSLRHNALSRQTSTQVGVGVTVGGAHLLLGDCRNGLARQVLQDGAAPDDEAAVAGRQRRLPVI